jgi:hypothetical protein
VDLLGRSSRAALRLRPLAVAPSGRIYRPSSFEKRKVSAMSSWFVPPIVVPVLLILLIAAYALYRMPG